MKDEILTFLFEFIDERFTNCQTIEFLQNDKFDLYELMIIRNRICELKREYPGKEFFLTSVSGEIDISIQTNLSHDSGVHCSRSVYYDVQRQLSQ